MEVVVIHFPMFQLLKFTCPLPLPFQAGQFQIISYPYINLKMLFASKRKFTCHFHCGFKWVNLNNDPQNILNYRQIQGAYFASCQTILNHDNHVKPCWNHSKPPTWQCAGVGDDCFTSTLASLFGDSAAKMPKGQKRAQGSATQGVTHRDCWPPAIWRYPKDRTAVNHSWRISVIAK